MSAALPCDGTGRLVLADIAEQHPHVTDHELARWLGVDRSLIGHWRSGERAMPAWAVRRLARRVGEAAVRCFADAATELGAELPGWKVYTEDGDLDAYVRAADHAGAMAAAAEAGCEGDYTVELDEDPEDEDPERPRLVDEHGRPTVAGVEAMAAATDAAQLQRLERLGRPELPEGTIALVNLAQDPGFLEAGILANASLAATTTTTAEAEAARARAASLGEALAQLLELVEVRTMPVPQRVADVTEADPGVVTESTAAEALDTVVLELGIELESEAYHLGAQEVLDAQAEAKADLDRLEAQAEGLEPEYVDPIAELLGHLADQASRIPLGDAYRDGPLAGASRYNVAIHAIRGIVTWDHHRKGPKGADCSACGKLRACTPHGVAGYPLCLECYTRAALELAQPAPEVPAPPPVVASGPLLSEARALFGVRVVEAPELPEGTIALVNLAQDPGFLEAGILANASLAATTTTTAEAEAARARAASLGEALGALPRWKVYTEDGDLDAYVRAADHAGAMAAAAEAGCEGDYTVELDEDPEDEDPERPRLVDEHGRPTVAGVEAMAAATDAAQLQRLERLCRPELGAHLGIPVVVAEAAPEDTATLVATCPECHHPRGVRGDTLQDLSPGRYTEDSADGLAWARCYCACHGEG